MYLFKVTIYVNKKYISGYPLSWACVADTPEGAIEQILNNLDTTGIEIVRTKAVVSNNPIQLG